MSCISKEEEALFGISPNVKQLSAEDAKKVAYIYLSRRAETKTAPANLRNVVPILGKARIPIMYAVNMSDGYVLVSATKDFYPIVAEVDKGSYPNFETGTGFDLIRKELIEAIEASSGPDIPDYVVNSWRRFEYTENYYPMTKSMSDDYYDAYVELSEYASANGYTMYPIAEARERELPDDIIEYFEGQEDPESLFVGDYSFENTAYILERYVEDPIVYGPFLTTKWNQGYPYNSMDPTGRLLGCLTVAVGQYMRYNEKPSQYVVADTTIFQWSVMPDTYSNPSLSIFLYDLRKRLSINDDGVGFFNEAEKLLDTLEYNARIENYDANVLASLVSSRISNNQQYHKIAIMCGDAAPGTVGHAWVCDGYKYPHSYTEYILYALNNDIYPEFEFIEYAEDHGAEVFLPSVKFFHMNWGWGGSYDGWFYNGDWTPGTNDFTNDKYMIHR